MPELKDLNVEWVSLVDRAAVRDPINQSEPRRFLLWKSEDATLPEPTRSPKEESMNKTVEDLLKDDSVPAEVKDVLKDESVPEVTKNLIVKAEVEKAEAIAKAEKAEAELAKANKPADDEEDDKGEQTDTAKAEAEAIAKADPAVRALLEKAAEERKASEARVAKAEKDAAEAIGLAKAEEDRRVNAEFVTKAEDLAGLPQNPSEFGPVLKAAAEKLTKEEYAALETVLKAADALGRESLLFKEMGTAQVQDGGEDAFQELQAKAEGLRKADTSLSPEAALGKAMEMNPDLQRRYAEQVR